MNNNPTVCKTWDCQLCNYLYGSVEIANELQLFPPQEYLSGSKPKAIATLKFRYTAKRAPLRRA